MKLRKRRVSDVMRTEIVTLAPEETLDLSQDIMSLGRLRHMPVVDDDERLVGIVSHRDLFSASLAQALHLDGPSLREFLRSVEARHVMAKTPVTVAPDAKLGKAARLLVERRIGCLPVVDDEGRLLGLVTETDLLREAFLEED